MLFEYMFMALELLYVGKVNVVVGSDDFCMSRP